MITAIRVTSRTIADFLQSELPADPDLGPLFSGAGAMRVYLNSPAQLTGSCSGLSVWLYRVTRGDRDGSGGASGHPPPMPTHVDAFLRLVEAGWDAEVHRRFHGQHTTVVVHLDVDRPLGCLHLGPLLSQADRQYLSCDATCEVWFHREGQVIGCGRSTRTVGRRLRRTLEHRHPCCVVPGFGATRGLHAHHIRHWEDGGAAELSKVT